MPRERRVDLLGEPTVEQRLRDAADCEHTLVSILGIPGVRPYDVTAEINAARTRELLFESLLAERVEQRLAGALPTRPLATIVPTLDAQDR